MELYHSRLSSSISTAFCYVVAGQLQVSYFDQEAEDQIKEASGVLYPNVHLRSRLPIFGVGPGSNSRHRYMLQKKKIVAPPTVLVSIYKVLRQ